MSPALAATDLIQRRVIAALAAIDPFTGRTVCDGLEVSADGLVRAPIVNLSGQFVWQEEAAAVPAGFTVTPKGTPYQPLQVAAPVIPPPGAAGDRLVRAVLQPAAAYPFPDAAIVLRGRLLLTAGGAAAPDALVRLQWKDLAGDWIDSGAPSRTEADGRFVAGLLAPPGAEPSTGTASLLVRLAVTRPPLTKVTPEAEFRAGARAPPPGAATPAGDLAWDALQLP